MPASRRCSECGKSLAGLSSTARTCGPSCRKKRARRLKQEGEKRTAQLAAVTDVVTHKAKDAAHDALKEELIPVVREALTQDVLNSIDKMMRLTPRAVDLLEEMMESSDENIRMKALALHMRYTLGNSAVAPQAEAPGGTKVEVHFGVPRPGDAPADVDVTDAFEVKTCMECTTERSAAEFVAGSDRCRHCHDALQARVNNRFAE